MSERENRRFGLHFSIILRRGRMYFDRELHHLDLRASQIAILRVLAVRDGIEQKSIERSLHLDKGTVAKTIKPLVDQGYVSRTTNPEDRRAYQIRLTPKGREIMPVVNQAVDRWLDALTAGFSEAEKDTLQQLLSRMSLNAREFLLDYMSAN
ncbi:MAG: MarR family transcriptional regulator [Desulfarculaceae bacterium]|nr:MarR family transcriptional regulator [Desulfarculaceae bacterium]MCF8074489.1 MarR family transcriptional regulator [Desulfarculaceae bacterium]MCF8103588.1 MarR family transcriptional regulator [Desulfarculaceae bacterium]MCF8118378.1 MarR family transcriptional regulator [Desulfarculaceae bacterium]